MQVSVYVPLAQSAVVTEAKRLTKKKRDSISRIFVRALAEYVAREKTRIAYQSVTPNVKRPK